MNASKRWEGLLRSGIVVSVLGTSLNGCSDRSPVSSAPAAHRDAAPLPMPPNAVTATLDSFPYPYSDPGSREQRSVTTPTITAWGFYNVFGYFGPGQNALVSYNNFPSGYPPIQIAFGKPVSRVRLIGNSPYGFEMKCPTRTGEVLSARVEGFGVILDGDNWRQLSTIDLSGPGIRFCTFDSWTVIESITIVPEAQAAKLVLTCSPGTTIQRGTSITCTAGTSPAGGVVTDLAWIFVDSLGDTITGPSAASWGGPMVIGGMMRVSGKVNGTASADSVRISVSRRTWPQIGVTVRQGGHGTLPPVTAVHAANQLMQTRFDTIAPSALAITTITNGPNAGWAYLSQPVKTLPLVVDVSDAWKHGSVWYNLQHSGPTGQKDVAGSPIHYCAKHELPQVFQASLEHEGAKTGTIVSHTDVFRQWFASNPAQDSLEKALVYLPGVNGDDPARWILNGDIARVESAASDDPNQAHTSAVPPGLVQPAVYPCRLRF